MNGTRQKFQQICNLSLNITCSHWFTWTVTLFSYHSAFFHLNLISFWVTLTHFFYLCFVILSWCFYLPWSTFLIFLFFLFILWLNFRSFTMFCVWFHSQEIYNLFHCFNSFLVALFPFNLNPAAPMSANTVVAAK